MLERKGKVFLSFDCLSEEPVQDFSTRTVVSLRFEIVLNNSGAYPVAQAGH